MDNPIEIISRSGGSLRLLPALPSVYEPENIAGVRHLAARGPFGHISLQEIVGDGFTIWHHYYRIQHDDTFTLNWNRPALRLWLSLKNSFYYCVDGRQEETLHERGFNIDYSPLLSQQVRLRGQQTYSCIQFHFSPAFFGQWATHFYNVEKFLHRAKMQHSAQLSERNAVAGRDLLALIDEILYCTYTAAIRRRYLAHKVMEALLLSLEELSKSPSNPEYRLSETVVSRVYDAGEVLLQNLSRRYTVRELCCLVGLSAYNLKRGFATIYNLSIADFVQEARMQKARLLLEETDLPIVRIAADTGYIHPFAFSLAFRKFFGYQPSLVRKSRRIHTDG